MSRNRGSLHCEMEQMRQKSLLERQRQHDALVASIKAVPDEKNRWLTYGHIQSEFEKPPREFLLNILNHMKPDSLDPGITMPRHLVRHLEYSYSIGMPETLYALFNFLVENRVHKPTKKTSERITQLYRNSRRGRSVGGDHPD
ncbi:hypothetical protein HY621_00380 [Candidatus Uhrbacteria bacterium]|nr:hypothetical protein [Candidatus Uhrbacteria bacterium]